MTKQFHIYQFLVRLCILKCSRILNSGSIFLSSRTEGGGFCFCKSLCILNHLSIKSSPTNLTLKNSNFSLIYISHTYMCPFFAFSQQLFKVLSFLCYRWENWGLVVWIAKRQITSLIKAGPTEYMKRQHCSLFCLWDRTGFYYHEMKHGNIDVLFILQNKT